MMVLKHVVTYSPVTDETASFIAAHFNIAVIDFVYTKNFEKIKAFSPNIVLVGYRNIMAMHTSFEDWAEVDAHEDWFLHDVNGNRLINKQYGWYAMDVGNQGWRTHYASFVKAKLDAYPMVDGLFADDVWEAKRWLQLYWPGTWTVDDSLVPRREIGARWNTDMIGMLQHVKSVLGNKLVIINTNDWSTSYWVDGVGRVPSPNFINYADGMMMEGFVHGSWEGLTFRQDPYYQLAALEARSATGKLILVYPGATEHQIMLYTLASTLLATRGPNVYFGFDSLWYPEMDVDVGDPLGNRYEIASNFWGRNFSKAKVFVNYTDTETYTVTVEEQVYDVTPRSGLTVPLKVPTPIPPIDLPTAAGIALALADAALIGYYAYTTLVGK